MTSHSGFDAELLLSAFGEKDVIAYRPSLGRALGSPLASLFLCQAIYWQKIAGKNEWFYKLRDAEVDTKTGMIIEPTSPAKQSWQWELGGMKRSEQETARKILIKEGLLEEKRKGIPAKIYFRVNLIKLGEFILKNQQIAESCQLDGRKQPSGRQNPTNQKAEFLQQEGSILPCIYTETTSKITTKTNAKTTTTLAERGRAVVDDTDVDEYVEACLWVAHENARVGKADPVFNPENYKKRIKERIGEGGPDASDKEALARFKNKDFATATTTRARVRGRERGGGLTHGKWSGFAEKNYDAGINEDGSF